MAGGAAAEGKQMNIFGKELDFSKSWCVWIDLPEPFSGIDIRVVDEEKRLIARGVPSVSIKAIGAAGVYSFGVRMNCFAPSMTHLPLPGAAQPEPEFIMEGAGTLEQVAQLAETAVVKMFESYVERLQSRRAYPPNLYYPETVER